MIKVFFPENKFCLFVSGGFDSAVMLHMYCLEAKARNQLTLNCITADKHSAAIEFSQYICQWAEEKHGVKINQIFVETPKDLHHSRQVFHAAEMIANQNFETLICAETKNPPVELPGTAPTRTPKELNIPNWHFPFAELTKRDTVDLAQKLGILEDIAVISHTCTQSEAERCGICWQCSERKWAFDQLGLQDPGNY